MIAFALWAFKIRKAEIGTVGILPPITPQTTSIDFRCQPQADDGVRCRRPYSCAFALLVMTATNVSLPLANWSPCLTNNFATNGTFSYTFAVNTNEPQRFYQVRMAQYPKPQHECKQEAHPKLCSNPFSNTCQVTDFLRS